MFQSLMTSRKFAPLFWCQFFSALNDNFVKNALIILILFQVASDQGPVLVSLAGAVLIAPFFILSALGGQLADRFDKAWLAQRLKLAEIPVAGIAAMASRLAIEVPVAAKIFSAGRPMCPESRARGRT